VAALAAFAACAPIALGCASDGASGGEQRRVVVEQTATGTRTTVITTRSVEAPDPPSRPADPLPADPLVKFNLDRLNEYRARNGAPPLLYDAKISAFALAGSKALAHDHVPHAHFRAHADGAPGFGPRSAENQGDPEGVPPLAPDAIGSGKKQIAEMLKLMFDEGPGGGHYESMMSLKYTRVGVGVFESGGTLFLTNDFSD
jgi:hypothetical protein